MNIYEINHKARTSAHLGDPLTLLDSDAYHAAIKKAAEMLLARGIDDARYETQYASGNSFWSSDAGSIMVRLAPEEVTVNGVDIPVRSKDDDAESFTPLEAVFTMPMGRSLRVAVGGDGLDVEIVDTDEEQRMHEECTVNGDAEYDFQRTIVDSIQIPLNELTRKPWFLLKGDPMHHAVWAMIEAGWIRPT